MADLEPLDHPLTEPLAGRELAAFVLAMESGTVQGAAEALSLTQSAATKRIRNLEQRLRVKLLERDRHGVVPTEAGKILYPRARQALTVLREAELAVSAEPRSEMVRVAASHTVGEFLFPHWLSGLRSAGFSAQPRVDVVNSPSVLNQLRRGDVEIGFVEGDDSLEGFDVLCMERDEIVVVTARSHLWNGRETVDVGDLLAEPYIARETGSGTRSIAESRLRSAGIELEPALSVASVGGVKIALSGGGFALLSNLAVEAEAQSGALVALRVRAVKMERQISAVRVSSVALTANGEQLWALLKKRSLKRRRS